MNISIYDNNISGENASVIRHMHVIEGTSRSSQKYDKNAILEELSELKRKVSENIGSDAAESVDEMKRAVEENRPDSLKGILGKVKDEAFKYITDNAPTLLRKFLGL